jgi:predicted enzyme related to lactoylglutathione lyase
MEMYLHHVQVSGPRGCEPAMREFYSGAVGLVEVEKPEPLRARGGAWFRAPSGAFELHVGIEDPFTPARKAHPAIAVADIEALAERVAAGGGAVAWDEHLPEVRRFHTSDPVGNRVEFQQAVPQAQA